MFSHDQQTYDLIIQKMKPFIIETGNKIVQSEECLKDPILFTQKLLQFKAQVDELVLYSFDNNIAF